MLFHSAIKLLMRQLQRVEFRWVSIETAGYTMLSICHYIATAQKTVVTVADRYFVKESCQLTLYPP